MGPADCGRDKSWALQYGDCFVRLRYPLVLYKTPEIPSVHVYFPLEVA